MSTIGDPALTTTLVNDTIGRVKEVVNMTMRELQNISATVWAYMLFIVLVISFIIYYIYLSNLQNRECKFFDKKYSTKTSLVAINKNAQQCQYKFRDYYIKTAYNCCSGGSYKNDYVSLCVLKSILGQGVRALDFEIYSVNDRPVVATSTANSFHIKETFNSIDFANVMNVITKTAFSETTCQNAEDPLIIHLRFFSSNPQMYKNLSEIFKSYEDKMLNEDHSYENGRHNLGDVKLLDLKKKIVLIVDKTNPAFMDCKELYEFVNITSNSIFMRALHYYDVQYTPDLNELIEHNKQGMTMAMPDKGINPSNPSGALIRETGTQFIAMRFQNTDTYLEENNLFFDQAGYAFVLKPEKFRYVQPTIDAPPPQNPALSYETNVVETNVVTYQT